MKEKAKKIDLKKIKSGHLDKLNIVINNKKIKRNNKKSIF